MRILVLADIHSNWAALRAMPTDFDRCIVLGDLVDYGTQPLPCLDWVQRHADACIRGNHDHAVAQRVAAVGTTGYRRLAAATRPLHWKLLNPHHLKYLARLPVTAYFRAEETSLFLIHATPRDPMDEYLTTDVEGWRQRLTDVEAGLVCVGHSHIPFHLDLGNIQVLNPGSVGQPRDGDWRASYALIEDGQISLHRVEYDLDAAVKQVRESGIPGWAVELSEAVLRSGGALSREEMNAFV
ncbi:metallophosphoesterase family protein [Planctomicrobium piriforme]|uniref:Phosphoesterase, MJ0936 family n=1 Tax=Planctomicrobium piriforme TaxID=1576369 RepID=A0A1I3SBN0_9PLAN|nr:metallophosphoesterase family protein [Planctomicrobium piriforme]SFJ54957.1 phosphoesterase, MJ0936 family [Planctomicrobium piriforme]